MRIIEDLMPLAVRGRPRRVVPFVVGYEPIRESVSVRGGSSFRHLLEPVTAAAIVFDEGWVLVDGGFDPDRVRDPGRRAAVYDYEGYTPIVPDGDPLVDQIAEASLDLTDLAAAVLSHAHFDHTGAIRLLDAHQPLLMQRAEWEHVLTLESERAAFVCRDDFANPRLAMRLLDGDADLAPGVSVLDTSGHTPGHQSVVVELPHETVVLAGDAADLRLNVDQRRPTGWTLDATWAASADRAINRLADLDAGPHTKVWPSHDPDWGPWRDIVADR